MIFGAMVATTGYVLLQTITEPWHFYLLYTIAASLGLGEIGSLVTTTAVSKWFIRMRGRALAMAGLGNNLGAAVFATLAALLIAQIDWRTTWAVLGLIIAAVVIPPHCFLCDALLKIRDSFQMEWPQTPE